MPPIDQTARQIDHTRTGLLLLMIGSALSWIPIVSLVGGILTLIGVILLILGRKAFGPAHARNVLISIVLFVVGIGASIVLGIMLAVAIVGPSLGGGSTPPTAAEIEGVFRTFFIGVLIISAVTGVSSILLTYALQQRVGKAVLFAAYGTSLAVQAIVMIVLLQGLSAAINAAFGSGGFDPGPLQRFSSLGDLLSVASVVPALLFTVANYLAWTRVKNGEIPARPGFPPVPA